MKPKQVIVMRNDLNMRKGKMVAQGAHAAMAVMTQYLEKECEESDMSIYIFTPTKAMEIWLFNGSFTKICVYVNSEEELKEICRLATNLDVPFALIKDSGRTEFGGVETYTAAAIGPDDPMLVDRVTGHLPLL